MPGNLTHDEKQAVMAFVGKKVAGHIRDEIAAAVVLDLCGGCGLASATLAAVQTARVRQK